MDELLIIGAGFAGFWSTLSAARRARELGKSEDLKITLISRDEYHTIRPRLYEQNLDGIRVPLRDYCESLDVDLIVAEVADIAPENRKISLANRSDNLAYDHLILATGSRLKPASIPGIERTFNVDTFDGASKLDEHLRNLSRAGFDAQASRNVVIVGGGFTGLEVATAMRKRLKDLAQADMDFNVHLVEKATRLASNYSVEGREYILSQLMELGVELHLGEEVAGMSDDGVTLNSGKHIETETVIWSAGLEASPLTTNFRGERDVLGRLYVDEFLGLAEYKNVFIAGDVASALVDDTNLAVMSCQHAIPQGKLAGYNAVSHIYSAAMKPYTQPTYATCLDLGPETALFTTGWDLSVQKTGREAKSLKTEIVTKWIYPPHNVEDAVEMAVPDWER